MTLNIWLCAEESAGMQTLRLLQKSGHAVRGVMTSVPKAGNEVASVFKIAQKAGIPTHEPKLVKDPAFAQELARAQIDLLLNVHSLYILSEALVRMPRIGAFNLHPGRLPAYAGLDSASWALWNGEPLHGVTLHWMEPGIDTGAIAYEKTWPSTPEDTALSVNARCVKEGLALIEQLLGDATRGPVPQHQQVLDNRRYYRRAAPQDGKVRFAEPAARVLALVRASDFYPLASPFGHPRARFEGGSFEIVKALSTGMRCAEIPGTLHADKGSRLLVACGEEWIELKVLRIDGRFVAAVELLGQATRVDDGA